MGHSTRRLMMGAAGAGGGETYVDDVFSTYLYKGNAGDSNPNETQTITNGVDLAGKGGLVWCKYRHTGLGSAEHVLVDTVRGVNKYIMSNDNAAEATTNSVNAFNSNGFQLKGSGPGGGSNRDDSYYSSWTFREQKGFFDIVTYTGTGSALTLAHGLGSVPGCIMIKRLDAATYDWAVYHSALTAGDYLKLNTNGAAASGNNRFDQGVPTSTNFAIGTSSDVNANGGSYVAYLWAGGESTAATARSVDFDGNDNLVIPATSDLSLNTNDFTYESWVYPTTYGEIVGAFNANPNYKGWLFSLDFQATGKMALFLSDGSSYVTEHSSSIVPREQWSHLAFTKSGTNYTFYLNGVNDGSFTSSINPIDSEQDVKIAADTNPSSGRYLTGKISNLRITRQVLYTTSFRPSTEPLTTTSQGATASNVKLLCCQSSTVTTATVTPGTITTQGDPTASTDSPFDDPEGFKFGEEGDQNIIKCGSITNISSTIGEINIGFEPQWVIIKRTDGSNNWFMIDSMRGTPNGSYATSNGRYLKADLADAEITSMPSNGFELTSTGFKNSDVGDVPFGHGNKFIYIAIRRPDGYVGKPAEAGTDSFAMDGTYNGSGVFPQYTSGFPVDMSLTRNPTSSGTWDTWHMGARLLQGNYQLSSSNAAWATGGNFMYDYNDGIFIGGWSGYMSWMWKRGAGFDVMTYTGSNTKSSWSHNLGRPPEMIWIKNRGSSANWAVGHKGLNGGTNPWNYRMLLNTNAAESSAGDYWGGPGQANNTGTPPTSTNFFLGPSYAESNAGNTDYISMLFASVDGISKVGYYTGTGVSGKSETTGFTPRMILIKRSDSTSNWNMWDSVRGWSNGLYLNEIDSNQNIPWVSTTATGFTLPTTNVNVNASGGKYVYYAHA